MFQRFGKQKNHKICPQSLQGKFTYLDTRNRNQISAEYSYRHQGMSLHEEPIEIDPAEEDILLNSDRSEEVPTLQSTELEQTIRNISDNLSGLDFGTAINSLSDNLSHPKPGISTSTPQTKRIRSNDNSLVDMPNPTKKLRTLMGLTPSMAETVKTVIKGHVIDIYTEDDKMT